MRNTYIVVGGKAYTDIDVLACASAYRQLLQLQGKKAFAVVSPVWNQTIPNSVSKWAIPVDKEWKHLPEECHFIAVDVSDVNYFDDFVIKDNVVEVFDHHFGFQEYWNERLGNRARIDKVGACATLIWEAFQSHGFADQISTVNANLLYTAILANTLDFRSSMTHERDLKAFNEIKPHTSLQSDWKTQYYLEVQEGILSNIRSSIYQDMKTIQYQEKPLLFGQLELWNANNATARIIEAIHSSEGIGPNILLNIVGIEEGKSYLWTNLPILHETLKHLLPFSGVSAACILTKRLWQRKEILKELMKLK